MHILAESLDEGLIGVNETGEVFVCNKKACQIARISEELAMGKKGEEVFPYIPFYQVLREKKAATALYSFSVVGGRRLAPVSRSNSARSAESANRSLR